MVLTRVLAARWLVVAAYLIGCTAILGLVSGRAAMADDQKVRRVGSGHAADQFAAGPAMVSTP